MSSEPEEEIKVTSLPTIARGAAMELFEEELQLVLENYLDKSRDPEAMREIVLTFKFRGSAKGEAMNVVVSGKSKLAPVMSAAGTLFVGRRGGMATAYEYDPMQVQMKWDEETKPASISDAQEERDAG